MRTITWLTNVPTIRPPSASAINPTIMPVPSPFAPHLAVDHVEDLLGQLVGTEAGQVNPVALAGQLQLAAGTGQVCRVPAVLAGEHRTAVEEVDPRALGRLGLVDAVEDPHQVVELPGAHARLAHPDDPAVGRAQQVHRRGDPLPVLLLPLGVVDLADRTVDLERLRVVGAED